jgi:hypothetical protein
MAARTEVILHQRSCRGSNCGQVFWICRQCDRGQHYCSSRCRREARRQQHRLANRRYQQSPEGRKDHRDRQREYRRRHPSASDEFVLARVTDLSSLALSSGARIPLRRTLPMWNPPSPGKAAAPRRHGFLRCVLCGRWGRFVEPFPRIFRR